MTEPTTPRVGLGLVAPVGAFVTAYLDHGDPQDRIVVKGRVLGVLDAAGHPVSDQPPTGDSYTAYLGPDAQYLQLRGPSGGSASIPIGAMVLIAIEAEDAFDPMHDAPRRGDKYTDVGRHELEPSTNGEGDQPGQNRWVTVLDGNTGEERATGRLVAVRQFKSRTGAELRLYPVLTGGEDARHAANDDLPMTIDVGDDDVLRVWNPQ